MKQPQGRPEWHRFWDEQGGTAQVAVLIDGDGITYKYIDTILSEAMELGPLLVPRVFGNWDMPTLQGWQRLLIPYRLERRHHHQVAPGKNATDIALVIDVLELVYQYGVRLFCLAFADSDYTPLVSHLRSLGCTVRCLGLTKSVPASFKADPGFVLLDQREAPRTLTAESGMDRTSTTVTIDMPTLEMHVIAAYDHLAHGKKIWVTVPDVETQMKTLHPLFDPKQYGHRNFSKLVKARFAALFEVRPHPSQQHIQALRRRG
ncbi:NYN domain-containing protein [Dictyobacter arantiisoli]|nr:NYN domain-containing protein [Dictyobacter arantiisoli]